MLRTNIFLCSLTKFLRKSILKLKQSVSNRSVHLQCHAFNSFGHTSKVAWNTDNKSWMIITWNFVKVKMTNTKKVSMTKSPEVSTKRKQSSRLNGFRKASSGIYHISKKKEKQGKSLNHCSSCRVVWFLVLRPFPFKILRHFGRVLTSALQAHNYGVKLPCLQCTPHCISYWQSSELGR